MAPFIPVPLPLALLALLPGSARADGLRFPYTYIWWTEDKGEAEVELSRTVSSGGDRWADHSHWLGPSIGMSAGPDTRILGTFGWKVRGDEGNQFRVRLTRDLS